jgi:hypothetical protein
MDHIVKIASILALPDLEEETKQAINAYIRDGLKEPDTKQTFRPDDMQAVLDEYLNGPKGGEKA